MLVSVRDDKYAQNTDILARKTGSGESQPRKDSQNTYTQTTYVDAIIRRVEKGKLVTITQLRERLAKDCNADSACAKVTGIFVRIVAETAEEDLKEGREEEDEITPYWRVVKKDGSLNEKFLEA